MRPYLTGQAGAITAGYHRSNVNLGDWFRITFTGKIGEICQALHRNPPDDSVCQNPTDTVFGKKVKLSDYAYTAAKVGGAWAYYHAAGSSKGKVGKRMPSAEVPFPLAEEHNLNLSPAKALGPGDMLPVLKLRDGQSEDGGFDPLEARTEHLEDLQKGDLDDDELTEEDLEMIRP